MMLPQVIRGRHEIGDIRGKIGVGELTLAAADAGEVEAQCGDASGCEAFGNAWPRKCLWCR